MSHLTYVPVAPLPCPFEVGDAVDVLDRDATVIGAATVARITKLTVRTTDGRVWARDGRWYSGGRAWPFPSIRHASATPSSETP